MTRVLASAWLAVVIAAGVYLAILGAGGFPIRTDLLALLPREERDPVRQQANEAVARNLGRRVLLAFGDTDRARARAAARQATAAIQDTGLVDPFEGAGLQDVGRRLAAYYFSYRDVLLSGPDRAALKEGHASDITGRALAQAFGFGSPVDATLLAADPFLLLPSFLAALPGPFGRLTLDDGMLVTIDAGVTWIFVPMTLRADPFDLDVQDRFVTAVDRAVLEATAVAPDLKVLRAGAIFFAEQGARTAIDETTVLTIIETVGTVLLLVVVFRGLQPLALNLLALGVGIGLAFAGTFLIFGEIHVAALLFGTSLIGVAVDYGLHYCATAFGPAASSRQRLSFVLPGISLGLVTTLVGYAALAVAPFPGLKQIAVFAIIGLFGAYATVTLWFPFLDRLRSLRHGTGMLRVAALPWALWTGPRHRKARWAVLACCLVTLVTGLPQYQVNDDVRHLQTLSRSLVQEQEEIKRLAGVTTDAQHLLVAAPDDETALRTEEAITPILDQLVARHAIGGYQMPASFVPSQARQEGDRALVAAQLVTPLLKAHLAQLGLTATPTDDMPERKLTVAGAVAAHDIPPLSDLVVAPGVHVVTLQGLTQPDAMRAALAGQALVRFVDPTADFSRLLGAYRSRAILLTVASVVLVTGLLAWRYGLSGAFWTIAPPVVAALLVPAIISLGGGSFTFFHAMGLVFVVAIGVDYTIFCAEAHQGHQSVTMLAILLATITTLLSFGLLALSSALAVRAFGVTMLIGITSAYILSPLASRATVRRRLRWRAASVRSAVPK